MAAVPSVNDTYRTRSSLAQMVVFLQLQMQDWCDHTFSKVVKFGPVGTVATRVRDQQNRP